ncbi:CDP-alcohol phosphatidyltransferase family protein [Amycolatopsis acidicola]|uniref:CDP-alcohol phosphatidyltransferase family protein n=1 Tax=Amycolatopsis acidicola TaxID=2596893 RepID=A0A5N0UM14_9PSEU|nr:CDP-alcohol phosphatidyltransferase family protein [Amycolatopsis acidicola]KAA9150794.1 CDP-alcohol phosphatidyltransferase family protein [Amycolatopsis acidicola]
MITRAQQNPVYTPGVPAAGLTAQILLLAVLGAGVGLGTAGWLTGAFYGLALVLLLGSAMRHARRATLSPADHVTFARAVLAGGVTALVADHLGTPAPLAALVPLASVALALDAVDGKVARRTGTVSKLGARFDMEVDAFLILTLSVHISLTVGLWALAIGAMRYVFVAAAWLAPWLRAELPGSIARKTVAALQGVALVVASVCPLPAAVAVTALALAALAWSFGRDVRWLNRERARAGTRN